MDNTEKQFVEILSKAIRNDNNVERYKDVNWSNLINLAGEHKVEGIIYLNIRENSSKLNINESIIDELKTFSFYTAISEIRKISFLENIFNKFNEGGIPVIALKGLVLRNLYPQPDQRSMYDADILVKKEDLKRVIELFKSMDYELESGEESLKFSHRMYPLIKVHWTLVEGKKLDNSIWNRAIKSKILDTEIITLGYEDFVLHMCQHMVQYMSGIGFGLRQIADLVLFTEKNSELINWTSFKERAKEEGIEKFVLIIFSLCNRLFKLELADILLDRDIMYSPNIDILIEDLLLGGIYGKSNNNTMVNNSIYGSSSENKDKVNVFKKITNVFNPRDETLIGRYSYASKFRLLKPFASIQQIYHNRFNEDYGFIDNVKFIYKGIKLSRNRNNLIEWLDI